MRVIAKRYAKALFELAREHDQLDEIQQDIESVADSVRDDDAFAAFLGHPRVPTADKKRVVRQVFGDHLRAVSLHFLLLLLDRERQGLLSQIIEEFAAMANAFRGVSEGVAVTAVRLTEDERRRLETAFADVVNKRVALENVVDPSVKGGVLVRIGDQVFDGTVDGKLTQFQRQLIRQG